MRWWRAVRQGVMTLAGLVPAGASADDDDVARRRMVAEVVEMARQTARETGRPVFAPRTLAALEAVPRHRFVPPSERSRAYLNTPLAIGAGQTISQPYIVALMTDLLELQPSDRVLEVGLGSGYQAAVLAQLAATVYSMEIVPELARAAQSRLAELGYRNVETRIGDGHAGWPERAPFDAILVAAAAAEVPPAFVAQLKVGGRLVIPLGTSTATQTLYLVRKDDQGRLQRTAILPVRFVPFTGGATP